jgi:hypothetical protein
MCQVLRTQRTIQPQVLTSSGRFPLVMVISQDELINRELLRLAHTRPYFALIRHCKGNWPSLPSQNLIIKKSLLN